MARILLVSIFFFITTKALASSCCGQSNSGVPLLSMGQEFFLSSSLSHSESMGRVYSGEEFFVWDGKQRSQQSLSLNSAAMINDRSQWAFTTAVVTGSFTDNNQSSSRTHLADSSLVYTYEVLPEYEYSKWKPVVYLSGLINLPTGNSIYSESNLSEGADVTGFDQWGAGFVLSLKKAYFPLQIISQFKVLKLFGRAFDQVRVSDFIDSSASLQLSYASSFYQLSFLTGLSYSQLSERRISPGSRSEKSESTSVNLGIQRSFANETAISLNYSDQTWLGKPQNTLLGKSISLNFQKNYY